MKKIKVHRPERNKKADVAKDTANRILFYSGFPDGKEAFVKSRNGKLVIRFDRKHEDFY